MDKIFALVELRLQSIGDISKVSGARRARMAELIRDEQRLGFILPPLLKRIYCEIGNGGFGPGYGLIGMSDGAPDDLGRSAPEIYEMFSIADPDDPRWRWPGRLLPICHWGCAIYSCVDCATPGFPMKIFDPNAHLTPGPWSDAFFDEAQSFDRWIEWWARGENLWDASYGQNGPIARELRRRSAS